MSEMKDATGSRYSDIVPKLLDRVKVAHALGVSLGTVKRLRKSGRFPAPKFYANGTVPIWDELEILAFAEARKTRLGL
jgi:predicted DNA-binding transcriptional regulator AlpA